MKKLEFCYVGITRANEIKLDNNQIIMVLIVSKDVLLFFLLYRLIYKPYLVYLVHLNIQQDLSLSNVLMTY